MFKDSDFSVGTFIYTLKDAPFARIEVASCMDKMMKNMYEIVFRIYEKQIIFYFDMNNPTLLKVLNELNEEISYNPTQFFTWLFTGEEI